MCVIHCNSFIGILPHIWFPLRRDVKQKHCLSLFPFIHSSEKISSDAEATDHEVDRLQPHLNRKFTNGQKKKMNKTSEAIEWHA